MRRSRFERCQNAAPKQDNLFDGLRAQYALYKELSKLAEVVHPTSPEDCNAFLLHLIQLIQKECGEHPLDYYRELATARARVRAKAIREEELRAKTCAEDRAAGKHSLFTARQAIVELKQWFTTVANNRAHKRRLQDDAISAMQNGILYCNFDESEFKPLAYWKDVAMKALYNFLKSERSEFLEELVPVDGPAFSSKLASIRNDLKGKGTVKEREESAERRAKNFERSVIKKQMDARALADYMQVKCAKHDDAEAEIADGSVETVEMIDRRLDGIKGALEDLREQAGGSKHYRGAKIITVNKVEKLELWIAPGGADVSAFPDNWQGFPLVVRVAIGGFGPSDSSQSA